MTQPNAERPVLRIDLQGEDDNVFVVISQAAAILEEEYGEADGRVFYGEMFGRITDPERRHNYGEALAIIHEYVRLIDTSGLYPQYAEPASPLTWGDVKSAAGLCGFRSEEDGGVIVFCDKIGEIKVAEFSRDDEGLQAGYSWLLRNLATYSAYTPTLADRVARDTAINFYDWDGLKIAADLAGFAVDDSGATVTFQRNDAIGVFYKDASQAASPPALPGVRAAREWLEEYGAFRTVKPMDARSFLRLVSTPPFLPIGHNTFAGPCPWCGGGVFQVRIHVRGMRLCCQGCCAQGAFPK